MQLNDLVDPGRRDAGLGGIDIAGLTADSREVEPGYLFAALPGVAADGARFIPEALTRGAAALLVAEGSVIGSPAPPVPVIAASNPRRELALMAARFYAAQPQTAVAVTGTNGKTSVVSFLRQIWESLGERAASLGTVGVVAPTGTGKLAHTSPDPVTLHRILAELAGAGVTHVALEASSHGLQQNRADGVRLTAGGFTNVSRDHLDYHRDLEDYLAQKLRLFLELLSPGAAAVCDADAPGAERVREAAQVRRLRLFTVGRGGDALRLLAAERDGFGQRLTILHEGAEYKLLLPLAGDFQAANALVAAGLAIVCGAPAPKVLASLEKLRGATGRLERVGVGRAGGHIFVDYAHTPDALANALKSLRPYAPGRLAVLFGCGGDRDRGKRPEMGAVASAHADLVYVTDDNPRGEDPAAIRAAILAAVPGATEIGDRRRAIVTAIAGLADGDVLLIAGKGHETGQIVGDRIIPFSDHEAVATALKGGAND